jgi:GT2 family glycosyltransferase
VPDYRLPEMSVVLVTPDGYETIRTTMKHLRAQTVRDRLEIVIVAPSVDALHLDHTELQGFLRFRVVEVGEVRSIAEGNAAGVRQASAPVVALAEDHSYPDPHWAAALIRAHRRPWAAVGPAVRNANPKSVTSWADFLIAYGPWSEPAAAGEIDHLPGHNSSYKRAILLDYGPELEAMLGAESVLHWDLRARGYRLYLEPRAKIAHLNFGLLSSLTRAQFHGGRLFAAVRAQRWPALRRLLYTAGALLIPFVRLRRILQQLPRSARRQYSALRILPVLLCGLTVSALGEGMGYALGPGDAGEKLSHFEFHRVHHLARRDRQPASRQ